MAKKKKVRRERRVTVRFTETEWNRVRILAGLYTGGDIAKWVRHGALEGERKVLK